MVKYRSAGGVAALGKYIYALGGHDGLSIFDSVERYDPKDNVWTKVASMLNRRCRLGVATLNRKLYACGGYDGNSFLKSVEEYDPDKDEWRLVAPMNVKRSRVALCSNMGKLWAIGGYDGNSLQLVAFLFISLGCSLFCQAFNQLTDHYRSFHL